MTYRITSYFHQRETIRNGIPHNGIDFKMNVGEPIRTIKKGTIRLADYGNTNAGKTIFVEWEDGKTAIYGHLSEFAVKNGQHVNVGELIGYAGNTGYSTGSHLHFGLKENGRYIDPSAYIDQIQNMNSPQFLANLTNTSEIAQIKTYSFDKLINEYSSMYSDFFQSLKLNLIHIFHLIDYSVFMQYIQNLLQFFS